MGKFSVDDDDGPSFRDKIGNFLDRLEADHPRGGRALKEFLRSPMSGNALRTAAGRTNNTETSQGVQSLSAPVLWQDQAPIVISQYSNYASDELANYWNTVVGDIGQQYSEVIRYEYHDVPTPIRSRLSYQMASLGKYIHHTHGDGEFWAWYERLMIDGAADLDGAIELVDDESLDFSIDKDAAKNAVEEDKYGQPIQNDIDAFLGKFDDETYERYSAQLDAGEPVFAVFVNGEQVQPTFDSMFGAIEEVRTSLQ